MIPGTQRRRETSAIGSQGFLVVSKISLPVSKCSALLSREERRLFPSEVVAADDNGANDILMKVTSPKVARDVECRHDQEDRQHEKRRDPAE